jgi:ribosomal protein S18 acetylase RimI-like enzyme
MLEEKSFAPTLDERNSAPLSTADTITLDPVCPSDEALLYQTFASTRTDEMALTGWNEEQKEEFLRMQFEAQRRSYLMHVPDAEYLVVRCGELAAGRLIVERTVTEVHIVDVALLPQFRKRGIVFGVASYGPHYTYITVLEKCSDRNICTYKR